jgi:hypothetical protein
VSRDRVFDPGTLVVGLWFMAVGVLAVATSTNFLNDAVPVLVPSTFVVVGLGLLLRPRRWPTDATGVSAGQYGASDEVGAEGSEDGEVEQAGRGHDG